MSAMEKHRFVRMFVIVSGLLSMIYYSLAKAEDVYNFYFQKGSAPQTVIQGGSGQTLPAKLSTHPNEPTQALQPISQPPAVAPPANISTQLAAPVEAPPGYKPFTLSLGYGSVVDSLGSGMTYLLGLQYSFNRFLGLRAQGRLRNLESGSSDYVLIDPKQGENRWGGMAALVFTPLRLELLGHRFIEFSTFAGAETYRKLAGSSLGSGYNVAVTYGPLIGVSALLGLNENFGIEFQITRSVQATFVGGNLAFQF